MISKVYVPTQMLTDSRCAPRYAFPTDAGADLSSAEEVTLLRGGYAAIRTGIKIAIPEGYAGFVHPRSGLAAKHGVTVLNAPGTIDSDYRGEVKVLLINHGPGPFKVSVGDRIAQLVIQKIETATFFSLTPEQFETIETSRGEGGFGSTGVNNG